MQVWRAGALIFCLAAAAPAVHAQTATATVAGTVLDESGAVVPEARVSVTNLGTNARRETSTSPQGTFIVPFLPPGHYRVSAQHAGFSPSEILDLVLTVGDELRTKIVLKVGRVDTSVVVSGDTGRVSSSPVVATLIDRQFVANIPLNGRSFQPLITMTPGVVLTPASGTAPGQFSVNGQRSDGNYFTVDGVSANVGVVTGSGIGVAGLGASPGISAQGGTNSMVSVDALQEFKIQSSTYAPEFGRLPGGQISMVTRSGTNQVHGSAFEYFRNDALDSADYFVLRQGLAKPKEHQHDFGGVFGGPLQRDRMFVFVSYEGLRLDQPKSAVTEVPSLASRAAASDGVRPTLAAFPIPNGPETANGLAKVSASYSDPSSLNATSVRVDRTFGAALTVFGRYNYAPSNASSRLGSFAIASASTVGYLENSLQTLTTGATWIAKPTVSNELRFNWSRNVDTNYQALDTFGGAVVPPQATLHPSFAPPASSYQVNLGAANVLFADGLNSANIQRQVNVVDALVFTRTRHQVKVGVDYRRLFPVYGPVSYVQAYTLGGVPGALNGVAAAVTLASTSTHNHVSHSTNISVYGQDAWSPTSSLTLTYGARWDVNPPPGLSHSNEAVSLTTADPSELATAPSGTPLYQTTFNNIAPRLGAAYRLNAASGRETVLRGGWGIFFDLGSTASAENLSNTYPFTPRRNLANVSFPTDPTLLTPPTIVPGAPIDFLTAADPNLKLPYTYEWNVAIEQALGSTSTVTLSYVGALGRRLLRQERLLNPTPQFQQLTLATNNGHSQYNALQIKYVRRLSRGLQALASYTLAKSLDNISGDTLPGIPAFRVDPGQDWGPSDFDVRHTLGGAVTYEVPAPSSTSMWHTLASGWAVDTVFTARSAPPVNVLTGTTAFGVSSALRPDVVAGVPFYIDDATVPGGWRINKAAFLNPPLDASGNPTHQGTLGRNALRGFAMSQVDLAVRRAIPIRSGMHVQLSVEAFNLFNQVNFAQPTNTLTSGLFGQATKTLASGLGAGGVAGGGFSPLYQVGGPRSVQLAARLQF